MDSIPARATPIAMACAPTSSEHTRLPPMPWLLTISALACVAAALLFGLRFGASLDYRFVGVDSRSVRSRKKTTPADNTNHPALVHLPGSPALLGPIGRKLLAIVHGLWLVMYSLHIASAFGLGGWDFAMEPMCTCILTTASSAAKSSAAKSTARHLLCLKPMVAVHALCLVVWAGAVPFISSRTWRRGLLWLWRAEPFGLLLGIVLADWMAPTATVQLICSLPLYMLLGYYLRCRVSEFSSILVGYGAIMMAALVRVQATTARAVLGMTLYVLMSLACVGSLSALSRWRLVRERSEEKRGFGGGGDDDDNEDPLDDDNPSDWGSRPSEGKIFLPWWSPVTLLVALTSYGMQHSPLGLVLQDRSNFDIVGVCVTVILVVAFLARRRLNRELVGIPPPGGDTSRPAAMLQWRGFCNNEGEDSLVGRGGQRHGGGGGGFSIGSSEDDAGAVAAYMAAVRLASARGWHALYCILASRVASGCLIMWANGDALGWVLWGNGDGGLVTVMFGFFLAIVVAVFPQCTRCKGKGGHGVLYADTAVPTKKDECVSGGWQNTAASRAAFGGLVLGRRLHLVFRLGKPCQMVLFVVWRWMVLANVEGVTSWEMQMSRRTRMPALWFIANHCLFTVADMYIAGVLELEFADVLVNVLSSLARFAAIAHVLPHKHLGDDAHLAAVMFVHAAVIGVYLWQARTKMRRGDSDRQARKAAETIGLWATT